METINRRRSIRKFKDEKVEAEKVILLLRAAMQAPSAGNQQPWEFIVIEKTTTKEAIAKMSPYAGPAGKAPLIIAVLANEQRMRFPENMQQDLGACSQNILLEAVVQGLGATWMSVYPQEERIQAMRQSLNLPEHIIPYNIIIVGYPYSDDANRFVDRFDDERIHYENY